ncbi:MAG: hypothetical protein AAFP10_06180 [Pseudomonadota bacterium]
MGEKSKKIGEIGENIVENFFSLIGWKNTLKGQSIKCLKPKKHALLNSKSKSTHGIDFLFCYKSLLESKTIESIVISVKHSENSYENSPKKVFNKHVADLAYSLECYKNSELKSEQTKSFKSCSKSKDTGILFWLSSYEETYDNIIEKIHDTRLEKNLKFESFYVVDNNRMHFLYDALTWAKQSFNNRKIEFYYPETSLSYEDKSISRSGNILPIEFITSPILPLIIRGVSSDDLDTFCLISMDRIDQDAVKCLIQVAREYTHEINCKYTLAFPNYVPSHHTDLVKKAKNGFDAKITEKLSVFSFRPDYRSLNDGE